MSSRDFDSLFSHLANRRKFLKQAGALGLSSAAFAAFLQACGGQPTTTGTPGGNPATEQVNMAGPIELKTLAEKAKAEGKLEALGIPPDWANFGEILDAYTKNYGVEIDYKAASEMSSAEELEVFEKSKQRPKGDIGDVGLKFGPQAMTDGLVANYKHANWADISADLKDPDGHWCVEYWGAQAFVINTDLVKNPPTTFKELLEGDYKNMVGINGDPRKGNDAFNAVYAAAFARSGSIDSIQPGIDYFVELKKKGNLSAAVADRANLAKGEIAIGVLWDYLGLGYRDEFAGKPNLKVIIPSDGSVAGPYVSVVNKTAPHPFAARLWIEYLFSDAGQLAFLKGYAHPVRYQNLVDAGKVPADLAAKLPPAEEYNAVKIITDLKALDAAAEVLKTNWQQVLSQ